MPRHSSPRYSLHKPSGQAVVKFGGRSYYLGRYKSPESRRRYDELIGLWLAGGRALPNGNPVELTIVELVDRYLVECERRFGSRRTAYNAMSRVKCALRHVNRLYGTTAAAKFGPKALKIVRQAYVEDGLSRGTCNTTVGIVKAMFAWGVSEELLPASVHHALVTVKGLGAGETPAREPRKVHPVTDEDVDATLPHVLAPVRAMIELQRVTGMRPGEVVIMRGRDLDTTGTLWVYRPEFHKTDRRSIVREIQLGPRAQAIIGPFLRSNVDEYLFRPDEAEAARDAECRLNRKTPRWPSHILKKAEQRRAEPRRAPGERYRVDSYARAILRGCEKAWPVPIPPELKGDARRNWIQENREIIHRWNRSHAWTPHRLRHSFATKVRKQYGIEAARIALGHQHVAVTEVYAERDGAVAATVAAKIG